MTKLMLIMLLGYSLCLAQTENLISRPDPSGDGGSSGAPNNGLPQKNEKGILATLALTYVKVRNACRDAYDEIMYWRDVYNTYETMRGWFERNKRNISDIYGEACRLVTDPGDIYATVDRMSQIFDRIDYLAVYETRNFDRIMSNLETNTDNAITGAIRPFTGTTFSFFDALLEGNAFNPETYTRGNPERVERFGSDEESILNRYIGQRQIISEIPKENWPDYRLLEASNLIASSAMAKSRMYQNWAMKTTENVSTIDQKMSDLRAVNEVEMGGSWYALENANANNKLLEHSLEEVKVLQGLLGVDMWHLSRRRADQLTTISNAVEQKYARLPGKKGECGIFNSP